MAEVIALKAKTGDAPKVDMGLLKAKAAVLQLAVSGLRATEARRDQIEGLEALAYEVNCLITDGKLPWEASR
jgi:hypothetical protein